MGKVDNVMLAGLSISIRINTLLLFRVFWFVLVCFVLFCFVFLFFCFFDGLQYGKVC